MIPIIFVHKGWNEWIESALLCVKKYNPSRRIIFLSDTDSAVPIGVEKVPLSSYFTRAASFDSQYQHYSSYAEQFELFCFQRWFVLSEFCRKEKISRFWHFDSDVLVLSDLIESEKTFSSSEYTLSLGNSPHAMLCRNISVIDSFCDFVQETFTAEKKNLRDLVLKDSALKHLNLSYSIEPLNDMRLWKTFRERGDFICADTAAPFKETVIDHNVNHSQGGFEFENSQKRLYFKDGKVFINHPRIGAVQLTVLHCQGPGKPLCREIYLKLA